MGQSNGRLPAAPSETKSTGTVGGTHEDSAARSRGLQTRAPNGSTGVRFLHPVRGGALFQPPHLSVKTQGFLAHRPISKRRQRISVRAMLLPCV